MTQDLISSLASELSYRYNRLKEDSIWRSIMKLDGQIPPPQELAEKGMFYILREGDDQYEEFRWKGKPCFQIRIKWDKTKVFVELNYL